MNTLINKLTDTLTRWIGSTASLFIHTFLFLGAIFSHWLFGWNFDIVLLVLTTVVSLEAIYLSIFIQRAVNQQGERLEDVEEGLDDVEEALDDVEEALDDVEEALDDVEDGLSKKSKNEDESVDKNEVKTTLDDVKQKLNELERLISKL